YAPKRLTLTGAEENLTIVLDRAGTIAGRVVAADGAPPGTPFKVSVKEVLEGGGQGLMEEVMNRVGQGDRSWHTGDADGAFTLEDVPTGIVEVLVEAAGYAPAVSERISIVPAAHVAGIEIRVSEGATVTGKVTVGGTISVEGATVAIVPATKEQEMLMRMMPSFLRGGSEAVTTSDGIYEIRHLAPGRYTLSAQHPKYAPSNPVEIVLREDEVFTAPGLNLPQGSSVEGTVTEAGKPKPGIMVQAQGNAPMQMATTDAEGHYQITGLSAGEYMFIFVDMTQASSGGGMGLKTRALTVGEGEIITLDVAYGVGSKIHGTLAGLPAGPMRMVTLRRPGGPAPEDLDPTDIQAQIKAARFQAGIAMVTPDGAYVIPDVEPGEYILEVPRMPADPTDLQAYKEMDRTPLFREEITVGDTDLEINIEIDE
ncbi:MAG: carboxypeptidase regulatory-like domain-containing protein, partial [Planctomycetota bacterium]